MLNRTDVIAAVIRHDIKPTRGTVFANFFHGADCIKTAFYPATGRVHKTGTSFCMIQAQYDILPAMKTRQTKSILVAISSSHAASRQKLRGIY
jgi:hypothetical protein